MKNLQIALWVLSHVLPVVLQTFSDCENVKMELVFVQDSSDSVSRENFEQAKTFIADTVRQLPVGPDAIRVALVRFETKADVISGLKASNDVKTVTDAIAGMEFVVGGTNTGLAMEVVREKVLREARPDVRSVVVVIIDGPSNNFRSTRAETQKLRNMNVRLVWLYIASESNTEIKRERNRMIRRGDTTFGVQSFDELGGNTTQQILNASCEEVPEEDEAPAEASTITTSAESTVAVSESSDDLGSGEIISSSLEPILPVYETASVITTEQGNASETILPVFETGSVNNTEQGSTRDPIIPVYETASVSSTEQGNTSEPIIPETGSANTTEQDPMLPTYETVNVSTTEQGNTSESNPINGSSTEKPEVTSTYDAKDTTAGEGTVSTKDNSSTGKPGSSVTPGPKEKASESREEEGSWKDSMPAVIGTVVGVVALAAIASGVVFFVLWRRKRMVGNSDIKSDNA